MRPRQALCTGGLLQRGYLANYKLLTTKREWHVAFSQQKESESENSGPFEAKRFFLVQPFHKIFFFSYPSKIPCRYRHFLFKIRSQYTWFSLFWLCTEVQKSQLSPHRLIVAPSWFVCGLLSKRSVFALCSHITPTCQQRLKKWSNM